MCTKCSKPITVISGTRHNTMEVSEGRGGKDPRMLDPKER
jgi:hypothetical protein